MVPLIKSSKTLVGRHVMLRFKIRFLHLEVSLKYPDSLKFLKGDMKSVGFYRVTGLRFSPSSCRARVMKPGIHAAYIYLNEDLTELAHPSLNSLSQDLIEVVFPVSTVVKFCGGLPSNMALLWSWCIFIWTQSSWTLFRKWMYQKKSISHRRTSHGPDRKPLSSQTLIPYVGNLKMQKILRIRHSAGCLVLTVVIGRKRRRWQRARWKKNP